jgi:hypothetical protein
MSQVLPAGQHVIVSYGPHPRDMVQIKEGAPYVVPASKLFVLTGLGDNFGGCPGTVLYVNGQQEVTRVEGAGVFPAYCSIIPTPPGFTAQAGSTITVSVTAGCSPPQGRAWGYLADQ